MLDFTIVAYATAALAIATFGLGGLAILMRVISAKREARIDRIRSHMLETLKRFLEGKTGQEDVLREMRKHRRVAIEMLIGVATELPTAERERLHVFFRQLEFNEREHAVLHGSSWLRRARAASELGLAGHRDSIPELVDALNDPKLDVRLAAAHSLAQIRAPEAVVQILHALTRESHWPVQRAAEILYEMGTVAVEPLLGFLNEHRKSAPPVLVAVRALGLLQAVGGVPLMVQFLKDIDPELRLMAARSLGQMGDTQAARAPLLHALNDPVWEVRCMAAQALGRLKDDHAVLALRDRLGDGAWWVRFNAAEALHQIGAPGIDAMRKTVDEESEGLAHDICCEVLQEHGAMRLAEAVS
jgi:HEAT repeat protein